MAEKIKKDNPENEEQQITVENENISSEEEDRESSEEDTIEIAEQEEEKSEQPPWADLVEQNRQINKRLDQLQSQVMPNQNLYGQIPYGMPANISNYQPEISQNNNQNAVQNIDNLAQQIEARKVQNQQIQYQHQKTEQFSKELNKAKVEKADFEEKVINNPILNSPAADTLVEVIKYASRPTELLYYLATEGNQELNKIINLNPIEQARELIRLEVKFEDNKKKTTEAPPPPTKIKEDVPIVENGAKRSNIRILRERNFKNRTAGNG